MKIAVDKLNYRQIKDDNEYIYLFDNETLKELENTNLHCIRYDLCKYVDINTTKFNIRCKKNAKITDDFDKLFAKKNYKFGIIIPNYNYSHTLEKCLTSVLNQTYKNYEIIFVDDVSTDNSVEIARQYLKPPHKIVELKQKRYNGGARNEAYLHLSDDVDYVYYVDSDDWLYDEYALEKINLALQKDEPDVLFIGLMSDKYGVITKEKMPNYKDRYEAMTEAWSGSCSKVIKKKLATRQDCLYNEGTLKEDKNQHYRICINMIDFKCLAEPIYVWNRNNTKSVTTIREEVFWGTSTIRQYADTMQLYLTYQGKDKILDKIMKERVQKCKDEVENGGDRQY